MPETSLPSQVRSAEDLMAVAHAIEIQAAERYRELARRMRLRRERALALLFDSLAAMEEQHAARFEAWSSDPVRDLPRPRIPPGLIEGLDLEIADSALFTPYDALAEAVRAEMRNFTALSYLAAETTDVRIRHMTEGLAKEELAHAALLRRERRKAFHARRAKFGAPLLAGRPSLQDLWRASCESEARAAAYHRALAARLAARPGVAAAFLRIADEEAGAAMEAAEISGRPAPERIRAPRPSLGGGLRLLEAAFERYACVAEQAADEAAMLTAQRLAERALERLQAAHAALRDAPAA